MPNVKGTVRKRNEAGLMPDQVLFLRKLGEVADWKKACDASKVSYDKFRQWIRRDSAFITAYDRASTGVVEGVRKQLESSAQKAAEVYDEALDATKDMDLELDCPHCGKHIKMVAEVPDFGTRLKAGDAVLRVSKILKDVKEVSGMITIADQPLYLQIAYARFKREGRDAIPPNAYDKLMELGIIKALPEGEVYDGEYTVLEDDDAPSADNVE